MSDNQQRGEALTYPTRAVVTAGMPYGNKTLHFGHIGGVFVPADCFARFLRMRIGYANVLFVSGTDCYGSPIDEAYRKLRENGDFDGSEADYVVANHAAQSQVMRDYDISLDIFEGSGIGASAAIHQALSQKLVERLYQGGFLQLEETEQFYDEKAETFLNGRQVRGRCPVQGCKSSVAYADECELGHQYLPVELIAPKSTVSGDTPALRKVANWYFDLPRFMSFLQNYCTEQEANGTTRELVLKTIREFLVPPVLYLKNELEEDYRALAGELPPHRFRPAEKGKASFELEFTDYATRDAARKSLSAAGIKMRSGKTLVPLRLTGNIKWGVPAPAIGSVEQQEAAGPLSLWVWPESLWAPISFSQARLTHQAGELECLNPEVQPEGVWRDYWCDPQAQVYQFIGQDNIYFYGIAQSALWQALDESTAAARGLQQSQLVANYHLLFLDKKASSSASVKPPMAADLLALQDDQGRPLYSSDALRSHFLALGLEQKPVSFKPKPLDPAAADPKSPAGKAPDPVAKEGTFLRNVFNRLARSCFYGLQELGPDVAIPDGVSDSCKKEVETVAATYDQAMHKAELHSAQSVVTEFVRRANKQWSAEHQLADAFYRLKAGVILFAPFTPHGCQKIFEQLASPLGYQEFFCWENLFRDNLAGLRPAVLPPRSDFF